MAGKVIRSVATKFTADISDFERKLNTMSRNFQKTASNLQKTSSTLNSLGTSMSTAITAPLVAAGALGFKFNSAMEQATVNFTTMLGSAEKAKTMVADLKQFADTTPFEMTGLTSSAQTLLAFGMDAEKIMPSIKMLGDVAMGNQQKFDSLTLAFAQIQSTGRLMGQDLLQLVNAGFNPLQIISEQTGMSMADLKKKMEDGAISADMVTLAFKVATSEGGTFYKAMDSASKTFAGQWSTLKDTVNSTLGDVVKPLFEKFTNEILPDLIKKVKEAQAWWDGLSESQQNNILKMAGLAAAIGPVLLIAGQLASSVSSLASAFGLASKGISGMIGFLGKIPALAGAASASLAGLGVAGLMVGVALATLPKMYKDNEEKLKKQAEFNKAQAAGNTRPLMTGEKMMGGAIVPIDVRKFAETDEGKALSAENKAKADVQKAADDYAAMFKKMFADSGRGASSAVDKLKELKDSAKSFVSAIKEQTKAFANFAGLFDTFERKSVSGTRLINRLKAQVKAMGEWRNSLASLEKRGVSSDLISDLRSMGAGSVDSVNALAKMSNAQLKEYQKLYGQKYSIAGGESSKMFAADQKAQTVIEKQIIINATGSKQDAESLANTIVKVLRAKGYAF